MVKKKKGVGAKFVQQGTQVHETQIICLEVFHFLAPEYLRIVFIYKKI